MTSGHDVGQGVPATWVLTEFLGHTSVVVPGSHLDWRPGLLGVPDLDEIPACWRLFLALPCPSLSLVSCLLARGPFSCLSSLFICTLPS